MGVANIKNSQTILTPYYGLENENPDDQSGQRGYERGKILELWEAVT
jgi:hypothetical protein